MKIVSMTAVAVLALLVSSSLAASPAMFGRSASLRSSMPAARLVSMVNSRVENDDDTHGDPDAYYPTGDSPTKTEEKIMSCSEAKRILSLRGGGDAKGPKLQIVFVSAEIAPWSITGGLGAVCDGLPRALAKAGHRVMSIAPRYDQYYDAWDTEFTAEVPMGDEMTTVRFFHAFKKGVDRVFVDHPLFLEKVWGQTKQKLYGPKWGKDYEDNQLRFAMFCKAAMAATEQLSLGGYPYGQDVVFVANDWHASLLPMYVKLAKDKGEGWTNTKVTTLLHNMVFQGRFPYDPKASERLHVPQSMLDMMKIKQPLKVGKQKKPTKGLKGTEELPNPIVECLNFLVGGVQFSDLVMTVSPGYAREVISDPGKGAEMETLLAEKGIVGILNGVEDVVDPSNEELGLDIKYDATSLEKKLEGKTAMQASLGFDVDEATPLFVFMGRLDAQKGVDVMFEAIDKALTSGLKAQFVVMGSGIEELEEVASDLEDKHAGKFKAVLSFKGVEKYKTYAAADFALMPSRYEPCGLVQMEGMRFGTLPIVAPTGGLADTVKDMKTGLVMENELDMDEIIESDVEMIVSNIKRAMTLYEEKPLLRTVQVAAMKDAKSYTWAAAADKYVKTFLEIGAVSPQR